MGRRDESLSDCSFKKNEFIFSWLKSLVVQDDKYIDTSLEDLFKWFSSTKTSEPLCYMKKESGNKSRIEEW